MHGSYKFVFIYVAKDHHYAVSFMHIWSLMFSFVTNFNLFFSAVFWFTVGACMVGIIMLLSGQLSLNSGTYNSLKRSVLFTAI